MWVCGYLGHFELLTELVAALVAGVQFHAKVLQAALSLFTLQLQPLSELDLLLQRALLIHQLPRHLTERAQDCNFTRTEPVLNQI